MTSRPSLRTHSSRRFRAHTWCECYRIERRDGVVLTLTSHDCRVLSRGEVYEPMGAPAATAERRESGLRELSQDLGGMLSSDAITDADLLGGAYDGAKIVTRIVDWRFPWSDDLRTSVRWVSKVKVTGSTYYVETEGYTKWLRVPVAPPRGGEHAVECQYRFGGPINADGTGCGVDFSADEQTGVVVESVSKERSRFVVTAASWTSGQPDDYYRDGEVEWTTGDNIGRVSPIVRHIDADREFTLLIPTPDPIQVGDVGTFRPGCDGLHETCVSRWSNGDRFGGSPWSPGASTALEPPR